MLGNSDNTPADAKGTGTAAVLSKLTKRVGVGHSLLRLISGRSRLPLRFFWPLEDRMSDTILRRSRGERHRAFEHHKLDQANSRHASVARATLRWRGKNKVNKFRSTVYTAFTNPLSIILMLVNWVTIGWTYFLKTPLPGGPAYEYDSEPVIFKIFSSLNRLPLSLTGVLFFPWSSRGAAVARSWWFDPSFYLAATLFISVQWALLGYLISLAIRRHRSQE
jgi:hypothetical protein